MKFVFLFVLLSTQVFASVTPEEKREALGTTSDVMLKISGVNADSKLVTASVVDEIGTRLIVEFAFRENMEGARKCSYSYDRVLKKVMKDSWTCDL